MVADQNDRIKGLKDVIESLGHKNKQAKQQKITITAIQKEKADLGEQVEKLQHKIDELQSEIRRLER